MECSDRQRTFLRVVVGGSLACCVFGCTHPGETTGVASATGGAIGAGLGAIIGSQTGDPGAGLVLGAAAGAGTGALIGNALEAHQKNLKDQDEAIARHAQTIKAQRAEIAELRRLDNEMRGGRSSLKRPAWARKAQPGSGRNSARTPTRSTLTTQRLAAAHPGQRSTSHQKLIAPKKTAATAIRVAEPAVAPQRASVRRDGDGQVDTVAKAPVSGRVVSRDLLEDRAVGWDRLQEQPSAVEQPSTENKSATEINIGDIADRVESARQPQAPSDAARIAGNTTVTMSKSENCQRADSEITRANQASEGADKLFHLRRALRLCPDDAELHVGLGRVYRQLGRSEDAAFEFGEALKLAPGHMTAVAELDRLQSKVAE